MTTLRSESYVFDPRPRYPLLLTAKRYWHPRLFSEDADAFTIIFTHGTGFHKEHWEPTFDDLCDILNSSAHSHVKIREFWSLDCPNHGDAAVLNEEEMSWGYGDVFRWDEYGRSVHAFLTGLGTGVPIDFSSRNLLGIGHSMGAVALVLATTYYPLLEFKSIIMAEPMLYPKPPPGGPPALAVDLPAGALKRRDVWPSREEALKIFSSRPAYKSWDPRVLRIFVESGLRDLPTALYPDAAKSGVTLKCPKTEEAACYVDYLGRARTYKYLSTLCSLLPVHFIYGEIDDYVPRAAKTAVLEQAAQGNYASVTRVPGAGHLIVQMQPTGLARAIGNILQNGVAKELTLSKL